MLRCLVPFCTHRTSKYPHASEWICRDHWRGLPLRRRVMWRAIKRAYSRAIELGDEARGERIKAAGDRIWERLKRRVIEHSAGI